MNTLLISYDLGGPETSPDYKNLITKIQSYGIRAKALESFRFIKTNKTTSNIRDELTPFLDGNDKLVVLNITGDDRATLKLPKEVSDWMKNNI